MFQITIRATSVIITPGKEAMEPLQPLIQLHVYEDEFQDEVRTLGFLYDEQYDRCFLHKGVDINYLRRLLGECEIKYEKYHPYKEMDFEFEEIFPPKNDDQRDCINFIAGEGSHSQNVNDSQIFLVKEPGFGKTFCTGYGIGLYGAKALIIMHQDTLRSQWRDSLYNMNGYTSNEVYELTSSAELEQIANGDVKLDYDVYLMTHATFLAACNRIHDTNKIGLITRNLQIGIKVIDEAHLHFRNTLMIDFMFNVRRNLYLTATDGRSSKDENAIFRHVFSNTTFYRKQSIADDTHPSKWVEYVAVNINTHVNPNIYRYRVNGGRGMSAITYGKWVIAYDKQKRHFKVCRDLLKEIFANVSTAKVIIFLPLIELCTECAYFLTMELDNDPTFDYSLMIKTINSNNTKSENEYNKRADVIVTTIQSIGTGQDIKGVTDIICCSPFVSKITSKQVFGRIRYINKPCHFYDIVDKSVQADIYWWKSRARTLKSLATKFTSLTWEEDTDDSSKANTKSDQVVQATSVRECYERINDRSNNPKHL